MVIMGHFIKARSPSPKPSFEHIEDIECLSKTKKKVHDEGTNVVLCFISKMIGLMGVFLAFVVAVTLIISKDASPVNDICHGHMVYYSASTFNRKPPNTCEEQNLYRCSTRSGYEAHQHQPAPCLPERGLEHYFDLYGLSEYRGRCCVEPNVLRQ